MSDQNKAIVRRTCEQIWNQGDFSIIHERFARDYVGHAVGEVEGPGGAKQFVVAMHSAFPDFQYTIEDEIAEGDRVVHRWTACGTHKGEFQGIPPTGKQVTMTGISVYRIANGKMVEGWTNADIQGVEKR